MACGQCSTGGCGNTKDHSADGGTTKTTAGCGSTGGCSSGGCTKMNSFDWLSNLDQPKDSRFTVIEIKFKGGRKEYFRNKNGLDLFTGDFVVCEMPTGYHIGSVSLQGELVRIQMAKRGVSLNDDLPIIHRKANEKDLEKHTQAINRDLGTMYRSREICKDLKLNLKLSEVEYQSDNTKATFYYSADDRIDFRELIKLLAGEFKVRVEMRQISLRQEAGRIGGIGSCGRELCCSTWLTDFKSIPTAAARYQNLSLNPVKLSGQCGRLKCCLNYELETYIDAIKDIPAVERPLQTEKGNATLQKTDIFRRIMWFSYPNETNWYPLQCDKVVEIQKMNAEGKKPVALENLVENIAVVEEKSSGLNSDLERLDKKYHTGSGNKKKSKKKPGFGNRPEGARPEGNIRPEGGRPENGPRPEANRPEGGRPENAQRPNPAGNTNRPPNPNRPPQPPRPTQITGQQNPAVPNVDGGVNPVNAQPRPNNNNRNKKKKRFNNNNNAQNKGPETAS
jgi:cell fate regulator YaaT (PSP1 superfamily)